MEDHPCLSALLEIILGIQESDGLPTKEDWRRLREKAKRYQHKMQHESEEIEDEKKYGLIARMRAQPTHRF